MIITVTGKPCSGKGEVTTNFSKLYNFKRISTGDMFREQVSKLGFNSVLELNSDAQVHNLDAFIDNKIIEIGIKNINKNLIIDSRLAWHFVPKSFKVFLDVSWQTAGKRLLSSHREEEKVNSLADAIRELKARWKVENARYKSTYGVTNTNLKNYNLVIKTDKLSIGEITTKIYEEYKKFMQNA